MARRMKAPKGLRPGEVSGKAVARAAAGAADKLHWYYAGCTRCGLRYGVNALSRRQICQDCRRAIEGTGTGRPLWDRNGDPAPCCTTSSRPLSDTDTLAAYRCGGPSPWWQCDACKRTHPYDPATFDHERQLAETESA